MNQHHYDLPKGIIASNIAHLYRRVSEARQLEGTGLNRQLDTTERHLAEHGLTLFKTYTDRGVSAFRGANRRYGELANIHKAIGFGIIRPGEHLLIESVDRLSRQPPMEALDTLKDILKQGIIVHTILDRKSYTYNSVNSDLSQLLTILLSMARAHEESKLKGIRVADSWVQKRDGDEILTAKAPGWLLVVPKEKLTDSREIEHARKFAGHRAFTVHLGRVKLVKWMFEQIAAGVSAHAVARMLNDLKETPWGNQRKNSKGIHRWLHTTIVNIITSKTVLGEYRSNTVSFDADGKRNLHLSTVKPHYYLPVIDADLWQRANSQITKRKQNHERGNTGTEFSNLFQHIVVCGHCAGPMYFSWTGKPTASNPYRKKYAFFRCHARTDGMCENYRTVKYAALEKVFLRWVTEVDVPDNRSADVALFEKRIAEQMLRIEVLDAEIRKVISNHEGSRTAQKMVKEKEAEQDVIENSLAADRDALALVQSELSPEDRKKAMKQLVGRMNAAKDQERFQIRVALHQKIREVISQVEFHVDGKIYATLHEHLHSPGAVKQYRFLDHEKFGVWFAGKRHALKFTATEQETQEHIEEVRRRAEAHPLDAAE